MKLIYGAHATHFYTDKKKKNLSHTESRTTGSLISQINTYSTIEGNGWFPLYIVERT
jgi:hypothetical protein